MLVFALCLWSFNMTPQKLQRSVQAVHQMLNLGHVIHMRFLGYPLKILLHFTKEEKIRWPKFLESVNHKQLVLGNIAKVWIQHTNTQSFNINISFALTFLFAFFLIEAACPVIPMFLLQAATNEAHLLSRENKAKPHSQSSICCYIGGLWIGVWAMSVDWGDLGAGTGLERRLNFDCETRRFLNTLRLPVNFRTGKHCWCGKEKSLIKMYH